MTENLIFRINLPIIFNKMLFRKNIGTNFKLTLIGILFLSFIIYSNNSFSIDGFYSQIQNELSEVEYLDASTSVQGNQLFSRTPSAIRKIKTKFTNADVHFGMISGISTFKYFEFLIRPAYYVLLFLNFLF